MRCLIIASTQAYAGKSGVAAALLQEAAQRGMSTAYFKPIGTMPVTQAGETTDQDVDYLCTLASCSAPADVICPVLLTHTLIERVLDGTAGDLAAKVAEAFPLAVGSADLVIVEGPWDLAQGAGIGLDLRSLADMFCGNVLLIDRPEDRELPEEALLAATLLGDRLTGVVFNDVAPARLDQLRRRVLPFLEARGVRTFGVVEHDAQLASVTPADIAVALDGTVLSAEDRLDEPVESFMVGAMGQEKALRYFRRRARKAVVTGGDRSDVQLAALETDTRALVLTGDLPPSSLVLARADELGVPMILVSADTLTAVEHMEQLFGAVRIHDATKVARMRQMFAAAVDVDALFAAIGLPSRA